jgi:hypothetical protein
VPPSEGRLQRTRARTVIAAVNPAPLPIACPILVGRAADREFGVTIILTTHDLRDIEESG